MKKMIMELFKALCSYLNAHKEMEQQQCNAVKQAQRCTQITDAMYAMTQDLYVAWNESHFGNLVKIGSPQMIRVADFCQTPDGLIYRFRLSKESITTTLPAIALEQIKRNMNADIVSAQRTLQYLIGDYATFQFMYPFLANGIYIMDLKDLNDGDVLLSVATHYNV